MSLIPIRIFEYDRDSGILNYSENVPMIPELKAILNKYPGDQSLPYMQYIHMMTAFDSPFANADEEEKSEAVVFDIHQLYDNFDPDESLLNEAVEKISTLSQTPTSLIAMEAEQELHRMRKMLKDTEIVLGGENSNFKERKDLVKDLHNIAKSVDGLKKQAAEEISTKMRGKAELGEY